MLSDQQWQAIEEARDALRDLLYEADPVSSLAGTLRLAYWYVDDVVAGYTKARAALARDAMRRECDEANAGRWERRAAWSKLPQVVKQGRVLNALADEWLTIGQLAERLCEAHPEYEASPETVYAAVERLRLQGDIQREKRRSPRRNALQWFYARRVALDPTVEALQRALDGEVA